VSALLVSVQCETWGLRLERALMSLNVCNRCEICDNELAKYRCGLEDDASQRQELGLVRHTETQIMDGSRLIADARQVCVLVWSRDECRHGIVCRGCIISQD